ncbi:Pyrimidine deaminase [Candidatus Burkholderia pumila]|uniref:Pyrimidine deaminase n=1 Tax=Candidatus Burkholderia pumila TaxID=1090375 RepID=A0ABR5HLB4_9BURK|nr:Pyrimidine deaminase [Candidatus Burkholderia pumila]
MRNFILLIALFFVTQWLLKKKLRHANERAQAAARTGGRASSLSARAESGANGANSASAPPQLADPLIRCAQCGVHTPRSESIVVAGECFCCADHTHRVAARPSGRDVR